MMKKKKNKSKEYDNGKVRHKKKEERRISKSLRVNLKQTTVKWKTFSAYISVYNSIRWVSEDRFILFFPNNSVCVSERVCVCVCVFSVALPFSLFVCWLLFVK